MSTPKTYQIRTLGDIYKLPTIQQVERCLTELTSAMLQTRAANDMLVGTAKVEGIDVLHGMVTEWPEVSEWIDDGKDEVGLTFHTEDGQELFRITTKEAAK